MNERRRFLHVISATAAAMALPACGSDVTGSGGAGSTGNGGAGGGGGGTGGGSSTATTGAATTGATTTTAATTSSSTTGGGPMCEMNPVGVAVGAPSDYPDAGLHLVPGTKVLIGRDAGGLYALTSICPHQSCDMDSKSQGKDVGTVTASGITCNCHGSKFDAFGGLTKGPAKQGLRAYALVLGCDGKLYANKSKVVPNTDRLAV